MKLNDYDKLALEQIHMWKNPELSFVDKCINIAQKPVEKIGDLASKTPILPDTIEKVIEGLVSSLNDASTYTVRTEAIFKDFMKNGHNINSIEDIKKLNLEDIDRVVGLLAAKYKSLALCSGGAAGASSNLSPAVGALAVLADIPITTSLSLRAIGEYATHYGYDISKQEERLFMLSILSYSSAISNIGKQLALANLTKIANDVTRKSWKVLNTNMYVKLISEVSNQFGIRLTKAKLAQMLPAVGVLVGAGYNAYLMSNICDNAYMLYRERYLAEYYNEPTLIEQVVHVSESTSISFVKDEDSMLAE